MKNYGKTYLLWIPTGVKHRQIPNSGLVPTKNLGPTRDRNLDL